MGSASNQLDTVERMNPVTETAWTPLPSLINKRKSALRPCLSQDYDRKNLSETNGQRFQFGPRISKENQSLCTGEPLYAPYSLLLISYKFWMGGGWGVGGGEARGPSWRI
jgi:hypothetical protein